VTPDDTSYAVLMDGAAPAGAEVHTLPVGLTFEREHAYRTIAVTRTDGARWYCRATLPGAVGSSVSLSDVVSAMPDGRHFCTGYFAVDRDAPSRFEWIMAPLDIRWSATRDAVFFFDSEFVVAYGQGGLMWKCQLPNADPKHFPLFDFISDSTVCCAARQRDLNDDGEQVYMIYAIDRATGNIREQWAES
jgi:hypothetical protein